MVENTQKFQTKLQPVRSVNIERVQHVRLDQQRTSGAFLKTLEARARKIFKWKTFKRTTAGVIQRNAKLVLLKPSRLKQIEAL